MKNRSEPVGVRRTGQGARRPFGTKAIPGAIAACLILSCLGSCAHSAGPPQAPPRPAEPAVGPAPPPGKAPDRALASLPPPARDFLAELRARVRAGDWAWAADRADSSFLRAMEGRRRDDYFYTFLFAAGSLASEGDEYGRFELLPVGRVRDLVWEEAGTEGPAAVARGRFLLADGKAVPFVLRLLWRLEPPRILGVQP